MALLLKRRRLKGSWDVFSSQPLLGLGEWKRPILGNPLTVLEKRKTAFLNEKKKKKKKKRHVPIVHFEYLYLEETNHFYKVVDACIKIVAASITCVNSNIKLHYLSFKFHILSKI